jgi:hypothetical protein
MCAGGREADDRVAVAEGAAVGQIRLERRVVGLAPEAAGGEILVVVVALPGGPPRGVRPREHERAEAAADLADLAGEAVVAA